MLQAGTPPSPPLESGSQTRPAQGAFPRRVRAEPDLAVLDRLSPALAFDRCRRTLRDPVGVREQGLVERHLRGAIVPGHRDRLAHKAAVEQPEPCLLHHPRDVAASGVGASSGPVTQK